MSRNAILLILAVVVAGCAALGYYVAGPWGAIVAGIVVAAFIVGLLYWVLSNADFG